MAGSSSQLGHWIQAPLTAIDTTGQKYTRRQSQPNPQQATPRLAASCNNKAGITQDRRVQSGKMDEPIISLLLAQTVWGCSSQHGWPSHNLREVSYRMKPSWPYRLGPICGSVLERISILSGGMGFQRGSTLFVLVTMLTGSPPVSPTRLLLFIRLPKALTARGCIRTLSRKR